MESDNLVWLLLGMLLAIGGALFMGCAAFISEQHAMISHVIVLEDPLHPPSVLGTGGMFPLHNGGSSAPAPTSQSDWQHNMAALEQRMRVGDTSRYHLVCWLTSLCLFWCLPDAQVSFHDSLLSEALLLHNCCKSEFLSPSKVCDAFYLQLCRDLGGLIITISKSSEIKIMWSKSSQSSTDSN